LKILDNWDLEIFVALAISPSTITFPRTIR
jgi:hypothetical protein